MNPTTTEDPTSDTVTQEGALKAAVRYVRGELNEKLDEIETSLERNTANSCTACGLLYNLSTIDSKCLMSRDGFHQLPAEVRLKESA